jgi:predicted RNA binding protein YcfA (HicA-like mRNA interferase family)
MPKIPIVKPKKVIGVLEKLNFAKVRSKGSHLQFKKANLLVTVPNTQQRFKSRNS